MTPSSRVGEVRRQGSKWVVYSGYSQSSKWIAYEGYSARVGEVRGAGVSGGGAAMERHSCCCCSGVVSATVSGSRPR
jgi:hypothetical protein